MHTHAHTHTQNRGSPTHTPLASWWRHTAGAAERNGKSWKNDEKSCRMSKRRKRGYKLLLSPLVKKKLFLYLYFIVFMMQMLQGANTDLFNHWSFQQWVLKSTISFTALQIEPIKANLKLNWRIFTFCTDDGLTHSIQTAKWFFGDCLKVLISIYKKNHQCNL